MKKALERNIKYAFDKVGILQIKDGAALKGRNLQTGEEIKIPASKKVSFRVASSLKEAIGIKKKKVVTTSLSSSKRKNKLDFFSFN